MPRVRTRGIRTSPLVPLVSSQRVLQVATTPPVAWTAPFFPLALSLSRAHRLLHASAAASVSSRARVSAFPAERLHPVLRQLPRVTVVVLAAAAEPW